MNEKEWLDYFETINNRKPTEEEIQQAKANGGIYFSRGKDEGINPQQAQLSDQVTQAVSQVAPAKTGLSKKAKINYCFCTGGDCPSGAFIWWLCVYAPARW